MKYDVIVVGSGPAGSTAARECALRGLNTLVIEKEKLPRHKPCGGAVSSKALSLLDFKIRNDLVERECYGSRLHYGGYEIEARKPYRIGIFTSRDEFDMYLVEKAIDANAELKDAESVKSLTIGDSSVVVRTDKGTYKASAVIGADGVNSGVANYVRPRYNTNEVALAMETE
ncbi:MAG: FAD-dependent monooxygenase, partial [Candidatus Altiarchaeota archaeon]|nr:FAD-dependent monooxygenase [Candidatus Altiarchaeota archaeon]